MGARPALRTRETGSVLLVMALSTALLLGCLGLAVDGGMVFVQKRKIQSAADAAALGAVLEKNGGGDSEAIAAAGKADSALNGFRDGAEGVRVEIHHPPRNGPHMADASYVEAIVAKDQPVTFMRYFGFQTVQVSARTEAKTGGLADGCVYVMGSGANDDGLRIDGTLSSDCGVYSNNPSDRSLNKIGGSAVAPFFRTYGGWVGAFGTAPKRMASPVADPLASLAAPEVSGEMPRYQSTRVAADGTLKPGIYHEGIVVGAGVKARFDPGLYVIHGGQLAGLEGASLEGEGVTFYFMAASDFHLSQQGRVRFSAPTSGPNKGVLFFQDRARPGGSFEIQGAGAMKLEGVLYAPGAEFTYQNQAGNDAAYTILVCKSLRVGGGSPVLRVRADYSSIGGSPIKKAPPVFTN